MVGEKRSAFTTHSDGPFDVCFENQLVQKGGIIDLCSQSVN